MRARIGIVQISHPGPSDDEDHDYWRTGRGAQLSAMYGELLGLHPIYIGYHKLVHADGRTPELGFEHSPEDAPPVWGDPQRPAQVHLDLEVTDLDGATERAVANGATVLEDHGDHRVFADPVGHPFCLRPGTANRIARIVFDAPDPAALATFYGELLDDDDDEDDDHVELAFQRTDGPRPTWPDPTHPAQLHLDVGVVDATADAVSARIEALGGARRPLPARGDDHLVFVDPAGHPFCVGVGDWGTHGLAQVAEYEAWRAEHEPVE